MEINSFELSGQKKRWERLFLVSILIILLFGVFVISPLPDILINSNFVTEIDSSVASLFSGSRTDAQTLFFGLVTGFGGNEVVLFLSALILIILIFKKNYHHILPFVVVIFGTMVSVYPAKIFVGRERPTDFIETFIEDTFAFPSGHSAISIAFFGYLVYMIWRSNIKINYKKIAITAFSLIILLIGVSRLYLGVHYLSDVVFGYLIGLIWLTASISISEFYRAK